MAAQNPDKHQGPGKKRKIGFDCEFVEPPPKRYVQSECPVCLQVIREPHQVTCCGKKFCKACIEHIKAIKKPCPTCNEEEFSNFPDKGLKQSLYGFKVRCSHQKDGCEWTGELGKLHEHLNADPRQEKQLYGCQFAEIDCIYNCGNISSKGTQNHLIKDCPKRPFICEHCTDYKSTFDDVTNNHWSVCGSFPVPCPNQCGSSVQRQTINIHVADECPLTTINCDFHHVGCAMKLPRQEMPEHQRENLLTHISLLATSHAKQQNKITRLEAELEPLQQLLETEPPIVNSRPLGPPVFTMTNFQQRKKNNDIRYSPPVYTHHQGYKICLQVIANGSKTVKGTHVSVYIHFMIGEFDDSLKWPFRGEISFQLLDQVNGRDHYTYTLTYDDEVPDTTGGRVTKGERSLGWGISKFIAHTELEPKYLRNDTLLFQNIYKK